MSRLLQSKLKPIFLQCTEDVAPSEFHVVLCQKVSEPYGSFLCAIWNT